MSEFSDAFALAFDPGFAVFGEVCTIDGNDYDCIPHALDGAETIRGGFSAGRGRDVTGVVVLRLADWTTVKTLRTAANQTIRGLRVVTAAGTFRIINDPDLGYEGDTVELQLGPLT